MATGLQTGVILITTKKSKSERIQFNFKTNQGWYERALPEYERTNPFQFMEVEYQNAANAFVHGGGDRTDKQAILNAVNSHTYSRQTLCQHLQQTRRPAFHPRWENGCRRLYH